MPREQINYPDNVEVVDHVTGKVLKQLQPAGQIVWSPQSIGGYAQIGIEFDPSFVDKSSERETVFLSLNRGEINRAIRFLRLARDKAYGRDE